ncbi:MAG: hypothetical protein JWM11_3331 [Planctomycetaceae bacterium]|nr:hypothetical protein [Planctomycetaceae bacterium]
MSIGVLEEIVAGRLTGIPRLDVRQFERFMESGTLKPDVRCELLDGYVVLKNRAATGDDPMNIGARHACVTDALSCRLYDVFRDSGWSVRTQTPLLINNYTEPEPDVAVIRGRGADYLPNLPGSDSVHLLIEVADSSLEADRGKKLEQYARAGIPTYWIVNLRDNQLEIYTNPNSKLENYVDNRVFLEHEMVEILIPGRDPVSLPVRAILDGTL